MTRYPEGLARALEKIAKSKEPLRVASNATAHLFIASPFRGKRAGSYGALLMAAYNPERDVFESVCKVGSGFTDEDLAKLPELLEPHKIPHKHARVDSGMKDLMNRMGRDERCVIRLCGRSYSTPWAFCPGRRGCVEYHQILFTLWR